MIQTPQFQLVANIQIMIHNFKLKYINFQFYITSLNQIQLNLKAEKRKGIRLIRTTLPLLNILLHLPSYLKTKQTG